MSLILIIEDEAAISWTLNEAFRDEGFDCLTTASAEEALKIPTTTHADLILLDVRLPGMDGISAIEPLQNHFGKIPIIIMTAFGDLETAVRAVRQGAASYLVKPFDLEEVTSAVRQTLRHVGSASNSESGQTANSSLSSGQIVGQSPEMQRLFHRIALVSGSELPVMITGESGTGKELVANAIHRHSVRSQGPFIAISLAAFNPNLLESELFGHIRGAFTGAERDKPGLFQTASGGTLFLDEIGDVSTEIQVKLLRVIEAGEFTPVGSTKPVKSNVRLIAATNRPLLELIQQGRFREDFYFRLNVFPLELPPLRQRRDDIPELVRHFLAPSGLSITNEALDNLRNRNWPGNIRQLRNAVEHATILARNQTIRIEHLPEELTDHVNPQVHALTMESAFQQWLDSELMSDDIQSLYETFLSRFEPLLLQAVLQKSHGQKQQAARILGIHRATLRQMLRKYHLGDEN
ncbi:MAG: nitrogen regulation protein [Planctomycetota bacterium]